MENILSDGSIQGKTFSGDDYKGEHPTPNYGKETYKSFYERCQEAKKNGFHLGDLSWPHWDIYCKGYPGNENYMQNDII